MNKVLFLVFILSSIINTNLYGYGPEEADDARCDAITMKQDAIDKRESLTPIKASVETTRDNAYSLRTQARNHLIDVLGYSSTDAAVIIDAIKLFEESGDSELTLGNASIPLGNIQLSSGDAEVVNGDDYYNGSPPNYTHACTHYDSAYSYYSNANSYYVSSESRYNSALFYYNTAITAYNGILAINP